VLNTVRYVVPSSDDTWTKDILSVQAKSLTELVWWWIL